MGWGRCVVWHFVPWKRPSRLFTFYFPYLTFTFWLHVFWNIFSILHLGSFSFYISAPFHELRPLCGSAFCTMELPPSWRSIVGEKIEEKSSVDFLKSFFPSLIAGRIKKWCVWLTSQYQRLITAEMGISLCTPHLAQHRHWHLRTISLGRKYCQNYQNW